MNLDYESISPYLLYDLMFIIPFRFVTFYPENPSVEYAQLLACSQTYCLTYHRILWIDWLGLILIEPGAAHQMSILPEVIPFLPLNFINYYFVDLGVVFSN